MNKMKIIYSIIIVVIVTIAYFSLSSNAKDMNAISLIGTKYSEIQDDLGDGYTKTKTAGDRITYSFLRGNNTLIQFAVKDDIIEVIEVYTVFDRAEDAVDFYTDLAVRTVAIDKCKLFRAYNMTMEFVTGNIIIRVEQLPTNYGWLVKYIALVRE